MSDQMIVVRLPDGSKKNLPEGSSGADQSVHRRGHVLELQRGQPRIEATVREQCLVAAAGDDAAARQQLAAPDSPGLLALERSGEALERLGWKPLHLEPKEGLALVKANVSRR